MIVKERKFTMATYTKEQLNKWNSNMTNGWKLSISSLVFHNEKNPELCVPIDDKTYIEAKLWYTDVRDGYKYTGLKRPQLHISLCHKQESGTAVSYGVGYTKDLEGEVKRATLSNLVKLTTQFTPNDIMAIAKANMPSLNNDRIM